MVAQSTSIKTKNILNQKPLILLGVLVIILILAAIIVYRQNAVTSKKENKVAPQLDVTKTNVDFSKLPKAFPKDIPLEVGAKITQNYNATTPEGLFQSTRNFQSKQSLDTNFKLYTDYLTKNDWQIQATTNDPNYKMVIGTKSNLTLSVNLNQNSDTGIKTVSISYSEMQIQK